MLAVWKVTKNPYNINKSYACVCESTSNYFSQLFDERFQCRTHTHHLLISAYHSHIDQKAVGKNSKVRALVRGIINKNHRNHVTPLTGMWKLICII